MDIWRRQKTQLMRANVSVVCTRCINISLIQLSEPSYKAGSQPLTVNGTSYTQYCVTPLPHPCWFADSRGDMCAPHSPDFIPGVADGQRGLPLGSMDMNFLAFCIQSFQSWENNSSGDGVFEVVGKEWVFKPDQFALESYFLLLQKEWVI